MVLKQIRLNKRPLGTGKGEVAEVRHKESSTRQACMLKTADLLTYALCIFLYSLALTELHMHTQSNTAEIFSLHISLCAEVERSSTVSQFTCFVYIYIYFKDSKAGVLFVCFPCSGPGWRRK
jgi:hypothetical protein